ncbi:hypothetical protein SYNPS1DRAFT_32319 [Syncephalis pseudoplumigaleata]|uniref:Non-haem dioxygenase N-terminal domain-containing protein n=1 Tax=Syncephalis pseudoplumigaleata TaxID=1712513 RepID=A0A4P9Z642_9FUNG|nr:hypothetical protein SYNPS1DRAFT_32319 [Syncephalis pseudoplumigaleata]|eukprot:RKP27938.1 hypothetical protein SYNPS1DRAFT_32319 [Syncephalis pseudoplumigaleata]
MDLPLIDLNIYFGDKTSEAARAECRKAADALRDYGALLVRDPRVTQQDNEHFLDMVEDYFAQPDEQKAKDIRKELSYQIGATPSLQEVPKCGKDPKCLDIISKASGGIARMPEACRPLDATGPDPKWRFFWRIGELPVESQFPQLNAPPVIPEGFPQWERTMNSWGNHMHAAVTTIAEMAAVGFGLPAHAITELTVGGAHLLAPTASDLNQYNKANTVLAGFHYDFNLLTIHGKSRFPGLYIWPRNGSQKMAVRVPDGCLLVQAGKEMEWLTGGIVQAGYHEVIVSDATVAAIERHKQTKPDRPLWRISSTFFLHVASDSVLRPLLDSEDRDKYPEMLTGHYVQQELAHIKLAAE